MSESFELTPKMCRVVNLLAVRRQCRPTDVLSQLPRTTLTCRYILHAGADPGFFAGGGGQRRPCTAGAFVGRADGGSRVDKHQIKVHSVHRIFRAI